MIQENYRFPMLLNFHQDQRVGNLYDHSSIWQLESNNLNLFCWPRTLSSKPLLVFKKLDKGSTADLYCRYQDKHSV